MLSGIDRYIYNTQMLQAEAVGYAYRSWRREWRGPGREFVRGLPSSCR
jgi:beta-mannosidase